MGFIVKKEGIFVPVEKVSEKALEQEFGELKKLIIPGKGKKEKSEDKFIWLRQPVRGEIKAALLHETTADGKTDRITPGEMIIDSCMVAGHEEVKREDAYYMRAALMSYYWLMESLGFF